MVHKALSAVAISTVTATALLVPGSASAQPRWDTGHDHAHVTRRVKDDLLTWTVKKQAVDLTSTTSGSVVFVYTCGGTEDPVEEHVDPALFQTTYNQGEFHAGAYALDDDVDPVYFECDGTQHTYPWTFSTTVDDLTFENGNGEVGLGRPELDSDHDPTFEHVRVSGLRDIRATVTATVDAAPEPAKKNKSITVRGTLERNGRSYKGKKAALYYQPDNKAAVKIGSDEADSHGKLKLTTKVTRSGSFFWVTGSTSKTQAGTSVADHVKVR